jgi:hypothetical protein
LSASLCVHTAALPWKQALPKALGAKTKRHLELLFEWAVPACLRFVRKELQELSPSEDSGLARAAMRIIESCLDGFVPGMALLISRVRIKMLSNHQPKSIMVVCLAFCFLIQYWVCLLAAVCSWSSSSCQFAGVKLTCASLIYHSTGDRVLNQCGWIDCALCAAAWL